MKLGGFCAFVGGLACLFGCARPAESRGAVLELKFWNGFSGPDGAAMEKIVRQFNREHPRQHVTMQIIPWATYYDKVTLGLAFGGAPDVFVLHANRVPEYADHGALAPLDAMLKSSGLGPGDFVPKAWHAGVWNGTRYSLPLDCHPLGLYYNIDLFKRAGIVDAAGNAKPPTTMAEFMEDAKKLTGDGQWAFAFSNLHATSTLFLQQFGGGILTSDLQHAAIDSPGSKAGIDAMMNLIYGAKIAPNPAGADPWVGFLTGKVAMAPEGVWMVNDLKNHPDLHAAAAPMPWFGPVKAVWAGSHNLAMPAGLSEERKKAAWSFIKYLSDHSIMWAEGGQVPVRPAILNSPRFQALPIQREFAKELPYVEFEPFSVKYNQITGFADSAIEAVLDKAEPKDVALATAQRRIEQVVAR